MILKDITYKIDIREQLGDSGADITAVVSDSRLAAPATLFVAVKGITTDGHLHIDQAIKKGAHAVICERLPEKTAENVCYLVVDDSAEALGTAAANFYDHPSEKLRLVGVTGTNGKTTTVNMLYDAFTGMGHLCGMISTIGNRIAGKMIKTQYTTPDVLTTNKLLREMVEAGCEYAFMEVSSHALSQKRTAAIHFSGAVFTNISHDHLDYHNTFREYIKAKQLLFNTLDNKAFAITNLDDKNGMIITQNTKAEVTTYSLRAMADFRGKLLENSLGGLQIQIDNMEFWSKMSGKFNAYNILAVYATGRLLGKERDELLAAISGCEPPEGRFEPVQGRQNITGIVDYAHTPDALRNVLQNISEIKTDNQRILTVVGCGGNRDKTKRPEMAIIATQHSDQAYFTSDNPRFEDPDTIINDMIAGLEQHPGLLNKYVAITSRNTAIKVACITATPGDIILIAGKGHEKYQDVKGEKLPFDDKAILHELLNR
jgi:UDP-N-acetylmuramoyl-L-alanyl-D-glutamate--2,6-diaminopimelate ligase